MIVDNVNSLLEIVYIRDAGDQFSYAVTFCRVELMSSENFTKISIVQIRNVYINFVISIVTLSTFSTSMFIIIVNIYWYTLHLNEKLTICFD